MKTLPHRSNSTHTALHGVLPRGRSVAIALATFLVAMWLAHEVLLLCFGGVLLAIFLNTLGLWLTRVTPLKYPWCLVAVVLVLTSLFGAAVWLVGTRVIVQFNELSTTLPDSIEQLQTYLNQYSWGGWLLKSPNGDGPSSVIAALPAQITGAAGNVFHFIFDLALMAFVGLYGAFEPDLYRQGLVRLFPIEKRPRVEEVLTALAFNLRWWMLGQVFSMVVIGSLVVVGMLLLGMPLALVLGLLAGLLEIIPTIGPIAWLVPALLVAFAQGRWQVLHVFLVYCALHLFESYVLTPFVQRRAVSVPPAISILAIVLMAATGGVLGLMVAAPLTVVALILVKMVYVEDQLGDYQIDVPGEPGK